eukprot:scaffold372375_cov62-Attheya_sp.AAC.1
MHQGAIRYVSWCATDANADRGDVRRSLTYTPLTRVGESLMSTGAANTGSVSATPTTLSETILRKEIMTCHTLAGYNKITSSSEGLGDLSNLDLSITITMDTCTLGALAVTLSFSKIKLRQAATTNRTYQIIIWQNQG